MAENGLDDLFEYGLEFATGNALGDGKPKDGDNSTKKEAEKSFSDKWRDELKKDADAEEDDELDLDDLTSTGEGEAEGDGDLDLDSLMNAEDEADEEEKVTSGEGDKKDL